MWENATFIERHATTENVEKFTKIFPIEIIRNCRIFKKNRRPWLEKFIIIDIVFALVCIGLLGFFSPSVIWWRILFCIAFVFSFWRIIEIAVYQFYAITAGPIHPLKVMRLFILIFLNYFEIILWFAFYYRLFSHQFIIRESSNAVMSFADSLYFSIVTMTTLGYGDITPTCDFTMFLISLQTLLGIYIALVIIARFVPYLGQKKEI